MNDKSSRFRFRLRTMLLLVAASAVVLGVLRNWEYIPGTYHCDENGIPHGTGTTTYDYDSGQLMLKEWYRAGLLTKAIWYRPDGTEIATEEFNMKTGGIGYYLRQDGTIKSKFTYRYTPQDHLYTADGEATFYSPNGTVEEVVEYDDGSPVDE